MHVILRRNTLGDPGTQNRFVQCSTKDEPLGKSRLVGHRIPEHLGTTRAFGVLNGAKVGCCKKGAPHRLSSLIDTPSSTQASLFSEGGDKDRS